MVPLSQRLMIVFGVADFRFWPDCELLRRCNDCRLIDLRRHGVRVLGEATLMNEGPFAGLHWVYFTAPWGMTIELVSYPRGMAYEATAKDVLWKPEA
jgi:hypothetical protein